MPDNTDWRTEYYGPLVGSTITGFEISPENDMGHSYPTLLATTEAGETISLAVWADEEGNGPGFLDIEPDGR